MRPAPLFAFRPSLFGVIAFSVMILGSFTFADNLPASSLEGAVRPTWHGAASAGSGVYETKIESKAI